MPIINEAFAAASVSIERLDPQPEQQFVGGVQLMFFIGGDGEDALMVRRVVLDADVAVQVGKALMEEGGRLMDTTPSLVTAQPGDVDKVAKRAITADTLRQGRKG